MRAILLLILPICFFHSCSLDERNSDVIVSVDTDFSVSVARSLSGDNTLHFDVKTIVERPCLNSVVGLQLAESKSLITLFINDVEEPVSCEEGFAPATGGLTTDKITDGTYDIKLVLQGAIENAGILQINSESIQVDMETNDGAQFISDRFHHVPNDVVWGYFLFDEASGHGESIQTAIDEMKGMGAEADLEDRHYGHFEIMDGQTAWIRNLPNNSKKAVTFILKNGGRENEMIEIYENLKTSIDEDQLESAMLFWDGREF